MPPFISNLFYKAVSVLSGKKEGYSILNEKCEKETFPFYKNAGLINQAPTSTVIFFGSWHSTQKPGLKIYPS